MSETHQHKNADPVSTPLSVGQMSAILERVTYKDGWHLEVLGPYLADCASFMLHATSEEPHSRRPGEVYTVHRNYLVPTHVATEELFIAHLLRAIDTWERHEAREFLRLDGEHVDDPHTCPHCVAGHEGHHA